MRPCTPISPSLVGAEHVARDVALADASGLCGAGADARRAGDARRGRRGRRVVLRARRRDRFPAAGALGYAAGAVPSTAASSSRSSA